VASADNLLERVIADLGGERRSGQLAMADAVGEALEDGSHLVVQAGTGTGKSLAYLTPAVDFARERGPVVVATATLALQRQLLSREIPRIQQVMPFEAAVLKGRHNYLCLLRINGVEDEQEELIRTRLSDQARALHAWAEVTTTGDRDDFPDVVDARVWRAMSVTSAECIGESRCPFGAECFAARARVAASDADIVVTNHALLAIDAIEQVPVLPPMHALIIDEAHELVDRVSSAVSIELSIPALERLANRINDDGALADAVDDYARTALEVGSAGEVQAMPASLIAAIGRLRDVSHAAIGTLKGTTDEAPEDLAARQRVRADVEAINVAADRILRQDDADVVWWDSQGGLRATPLDVGEVLANTIFAQTPVILTSATLTVGGSFDNFLAAVGLSPTTACLDVGSGFDHAKQGMLYVAASLPAPDRDGIAMEALDELAELIEAAGGRTLALFSSWRGVERAAEYLRVRLDGDLELVVQQRGESTIPLIEQFAADPTSVLIGTVSLWQGIDVPGDSCTLVAIDRIPFPRPDDPVLAARARRVDSAGGSGFREVSLARAALLLAQGAGRLIRSAEDRGVVAVLDSRMASARYAGLLRASLPPLWFTTDSAVVRDALRRLADASELDEAH
jgi:ATP-dependent DNA helicase DinG